MLGFNDEEIANRFEEWSERVHPDDLNTAMEAVHRHFRSETPYYQSEIRLRHRSGDYIWILARGIVIGRDKDGSPNRMIGIHQDVTARKKIEKDLLENQAKLSLFIQHAPAALAMFDADMCYLAASERWIEDYHLQGQVILGRCHYEVFPDISEAWKTVHRRGLAGEVIKADQDCFVRTNGEQQWLRWEVRPWLTKENAVGGIAIFAEDITQQKLMESERQRWADAFYHCAQGIVIGNPNNNVIEYCNQAFAALLGYVSPNELKGHLIKDLYAVDNTDTVIKHLQDADRLGQTRYESVYRHVDGSCFEVQVDIVSVKNKDGSLLYRVATVQDISQRKRDAQTLQLQSSALKAAANAIMITDPNGIIEWINPAFTRMTGYSVEEAIGYDVDQLINSNQQNQPNFIEKLQSITLDKIWQGELINRRKDGSFYTEEQLITPVFDDQMIIRHFIAIKQDISLRKQNNQELMQHRNHLEQLVRERTIELEQARQEAERLSKIKSHFLANMSHEIRTPMNAVLGFCYLLAQRSLDRESLDLVRKIHNAGDSLLSIINDILDFSKIEAGRMNIENEPFRLSVLLDELASLMSTLAGRKNLELVITPLYSVDRLQGDKQHLQQVLVNLLGNAIKFTEQGEVELRIESIQTPDNQEALRFLVRDTGIGISREQLAEIFSAFSQADTSISRRFGGTGLGLAICQRLVALMGGNLDVTSQEGIGSEFSFQLPIQSADPIAITAKHLEHMNLLVADDSASSREALSTTIKSLGWRVDTVDSGNAALRQVLMRWQEHNPYDMLLLDWQMPEMGGLATARAIHTALSSRFGEQRKLPIVYMVTAYDRELIAAQPGIENVHSLLSKPVTASVLYSTIAELMERRKDSTKINDLIPSTNVDQHLQGVLALLVDDSEINIQVAQLILESYGAIVYTAFNGQDAVDWLHAHPEEVDIVLMDVQMPVMDGYSATHLIRQDSRWHNLPIVALSAGVLKDEQEQAIAAGMNGFVSKPIDVEYILATIQLLTSSQTSPTNFQVQIQHGTASDVGGSLFDGYSHADTLPDIDFDEGIRQWRNIEVYQTYLHKFVESYATSGHILADLLAAHNKAAASALVHKLKGVAGNLALKKIAAQAEAFEANLKAEIVLNSTLKSLQIAIDQACTAIATWAPNHESPSEISLSTHNPINPGELIELLEQFLQTLDRDNPALSEPVLLQLKSKLPKPEFSEIQSKLSMFDFRSAERLTLAILSKMKMHNNKKK